MKNTSIIFMCTVMIITIMILSGCTCDYHNLQEEIIKSPTCTVDGIKREYCTECEYSVEEPISSSHSFEREKVLREATCAIDGEAIYKCTICGKTENKKTYASHSFSGRTCTECFYKKPLPELSVGMSKSTVEMKWGEPVEIDKSTSSRGTEETWWYIEDGNAIAVNFDVDGKVWLITK